MEDSSDFNRINPCFQRLSKALLLKWPSRIYNMSKNHLYLIGFLLAFIYFSLLIVERTWPLRKQSRPLLSRIVVNFSFTLLVYIIASLLISPLAKFIMTRTSIHGLGLLQLLPMNRFTHFVLGFLLMDLTFYYWHRLNHEIPLLWRFHNVHHVDPDLDVTTSMRFHVVEIVYSSVFRLIQLSLIGINPITFFCYEFIFQCNTFFQHSNIKLPIGFERIVNKIIVTPRMHGIHHSNYENETNRNYSVVFSFWDRIHKTIKLNVPQQAITIGVPAYEKPTDNSLLNLLIMPFKSQRRYWRLNNKKHVSRDQSRFDENVDYLSE